MKLGSVFALAVGWSLVEQWLNEKPRPGGEGADQFYRHMSALHGSFGACSMIFVVFAVLNALARTADGAWIWFQLP